MIRKNILKFVYSFFILCFFGIGCSVPFPGDASGVLLLALLNSNSNNGSGTTDPVLSYKFLFVTTGPGTTGALGDVTGADSTCATQKNNNFASLPGTGTEYKALIVSTVPLRRACNGTANCTDPTENSNWVLLPNRDYYRGTVANPIKVFTTNTAGIATFPITAAIDTNGANIWWTGLTSDWRISVGDTCSDWVDGTAGSTGEFGSGAVSNLNSINSGGFSDPCNSTKKLICVRQ
ncbi:DUF1554 domain-containing protein [Leptospira sp. FAT2]|uniref:DUF1554 domain-containing protein n=1 Tax=Leptospira sanjuanensis TaxID=2879643 RepID=UPI001EE92403|nr:DUF1554 domain-containing protein [Leptospira sanjuanensis]MCG6168984.1 DUF1554 domain-containing protein [Leptospira sanjuanensis]MCG6194384.1 DUF1554 domain-containing protein [Leptospira sanjuanensis]